MSIEFLASPLFWSTLEKKTETNPVIPKKIAEFVSKKIGQYNDHPSKVAVPVTKYDKIFSSNGHIKTAVPGENLRHIHLDLDISLVYSLSGGDTKYIKLYGVFNHRDLGTDPSQGNKGSSSGILTVLSNQNIWSPFNSSSKEKQIENIKIIPISQIPMIDTSYNVRIIGDILNRDAGLKVPSSIKLHHMIKILQSDEDARRKLIDYTVEHPFKVRQQKDQFILLDDNERHLLFLLKQISVKKVPVQLPGKKGVKEYQMDESTILKIKKIMLS